MPSLRAVLADIVDHKLDPNKVYSKVGADGHLKSEGRSTKRVPIDHPQPPSVAQFVVQETMSANVESIELDVSIEVLPEPEPFVEPPPPPLVKTTKWDPVVQTVQVAEPAETMEELPELPVTLPSVEEEHLVIKETHDEQPVEVEKIEKRPTDQRQKKGRRKEKKVVIG